MAARCDGNALEVLKAFREGIDSSRSGAEHQHVCGSASATVYDAYQVSSGVEDQGVADCARGIAEGDSDAYGTKGGMAGNGTANLNDAAGADVDSVTGGAGDSARVVDDSRCTAGNACGAGDRRKSIICERRGRTLAYADDAASRTIFAFAPRFERAVGVAAARRIRAGQRRSGNPGA
jgi:hypothetical protein